jgi:hypothetical protein
MMASTQLLDDETLSHRRLVHVILQSHDDTIYSPNSKRQ